MIESLVKIGQLSVVSCQLPVFGFWSLALWPEPQLPLNWSRPRDIKDQSPKTKDQQLTTDYGQLTDLGLVEQFSRVLLCIFRRFEPAASAPAMSRPFRRGVLNRSR
jgi:hypothetical protein